MSEGPV